jgi:hypothetical protein
VGAGGGGAGRRAPRPEARGGEAAAVAGRSACPADVGARRCWQIQTLGALNLLELSGAFGYRHAARGPALPPPRRLIAARASRPQARRCWGTAIQYGRSRGLPRGVCARQPRPRWAPVTLNLGLGRIVVSEKRGANSLSESGRKWMNGGTKRQCDRNLPQPLCRSREEAGGIVEEEAMRCQCDPAPGLKIFWGFSLRNQGQLMLVLSMC